MKYNVSLPPNLGRCHSSGGCTPEWGILVHQLPEKSVEKALRRLPKVTRHTRVDKLGMQVCFWSKENFERSVRLKRIRLDKTSYSIYPLVTCLTVYGLNNYARPDEIGKFFRDEKTDILTFYPIPNTDDYRVVLNVSEVHMFSDLAPISLSDSTFRIAFFCRVCRREGHMQYQCCSTNSTVPPQKRIRTVNPVRQGNRESSSQDGDRHLNKCINEKRKKTCPVAGSIQGAQATPGCSHQKSNKKHKKVQKRNFPCVQIRTIITKISGELEPQHMIQFLSDVYCKKKPIEVAKIFTNNIPSLVQQLQSIISHYHHGTSKSQMTDRDIKIMTDLQDRLKRQAN